MASASLQRLLAREQRAFLGRPRRAWGDHLARVRAFLGEALRASDRARPVLVLGAGSGLEVPWRLAPAGSEGWDADPWSRVRTYLRHGRWLPWTFKDLTGGMTPLAELLDRNLRRDWLGRPLGRRSVALARLAGLLDTLPAEPQALEAALERLRPGLVIAANVMGQFGSVAEALVEQACGESPWQEDPDLPDPLAEALGRWTGRAVRRFLEVLRDSGAPLCLVHDRAVLDRVVPLGDWADDWRTHLMPAGPLEVMDPLSGVDAVALLGRPDLRKTRWLWPVGPGQVHLVEALSCGAAPPSAAGSPAP